MELFTKEQASEIVFRPQPLNDNLKQVCISRLSSLNNHKFIKEFRKSTGLTLCCFAPGLYYIKY